MDAEKLYNAWSNDKEFKVVAQLFVKPCKKTVLSMNIIDIKEVDYNEKKIIIHLSKNGLEYILECFNLLKNTENNNDFASISEGEYHIDIFDVNPNLKIQIYNDNVNVTVICNTAAISNKNIYLFF